MMQNDLRQSTVREAGKLVNITEIKQRRLNIIIYVNTVVPGTLGINDFWIYQGSPKSGE